MYLSDVYKAFTEARRANRWSEEKECFVDIEALVAAIPIVGVWCKRLEEISNYRQKIDEGIKKVIYATLEKKKKKKKKKKTVEEIVDESQKLVDEVKKADEKA
ncbi:hypothetical protein Hanom_Chr16g01462341 [Helianthus anomalus]